MAGTNKYDSQHRRNLAAYERRVEDIFRTAAREAARLGLSIKDFNPARLFSFSDYPATRKKIEKLLSDLQSAIEGVVVNGIRSEWALSNNKNNELARQVFGDNVGKLTKEQERRYFSTNGAARDAFIKRKTDGLGLSDRVWKYTNQFKDEIELGLDIGIRSGRSADELSRDLRSYLQHPDKLFRRVRNEHGQLVLSRRAKAYHPGRGVYRSSYKNARRLAATETNIAYMTADYERWQQLDFVVGIEVRLSGNHPCHDICDDLKGRYPKDFKFTGWHPHCRCHVVTILKTDKELAADARRILAGQEPTADSANRVTDVPQGFKQWLKDNEERAKCAESLPYFMKNNPSVLKEHTPEIHNILVKRAISNAKSVASDFQRQVEVIARKFDAIVTPVNLKSVESTVRKINEDSDNHIGSIRDLVRNTIIVEDADRIGHIVEEIQKRFIVPLGEKGKPRIKSQNTPLGYTGTLVNVQLKGVQGEIQINIPQMIYAKDESAKELLPKDLFDKIKRESGLECGHGHKYYEEWRLPTTSSARKRELEKLSQAYYKAIRKVKL